jgi:DNA-binding transcriptional ArsR family regulator
MGRCRVVVVSIPWNHNGCNMFQEYLFLEASGYLRCVAEWSFFTNHAQALVCIAQDPGVRLRDVATVLGVTERRAFDIVNDLVEAGYVEKEKDGRRNLYRIRTQLPLRRPIGKEPTIGEVLGMLVDVDDRAIHSGKSQ